MLGPTTLLKMEHGFTIKDAIFLMLILGAIVALFSAVITVRQYGEMLMNPVGYNMAQFGLNSCSCYDTEGELTLIQSTNYTKVKETEVFQWANQS